MVRGALKQLASGRALWMVLMAMCLATFAGVTRAAEPTAAEKAAAEAKDKAAAALKAEIEKRPSSPAPAVVPVDVYSYKAPNGKFYVDEAAYKDEQEVAAIYAKPEYKAAEATAPVVGKDATNSGDVAWMLTSAALVLMMTGPGLALFYSGLVRRKNVLATMMQSFILMAIVSVVWAVVGYSLAFAEGSTPYIGGLRFAFLKGVGAEACEYAPTIPHQLWMIYQCMFAIITPALICGAYAERMKFSSMVIFSILWLLVVYCPMAHMVWAKGGLLNAWNGGKVLAIDFAGGTVVHIASGVSALICCLVMGKRRGYGKVPMPPHSVVLSLIGAALLWVGWFGFNAGSALSAGPAAVNAFLTTHFAAATATLGWVVVEWIKTGKPTVLGAISGAVAGLVVITPAAGYVTPNYALIMGFLGGVVCFFSATSLKHALGYDDSLDAFGVHGMGGTLGAILTGVFGVWAVNNVPAYVAAGATEGKIGLLEGGTALTAQLIATGLTWVVAAVGSFILLKLVDVVLGLRVTEADEYEGLDISQHGERGYNFEEEFGGTVLEGSDSAAPAVAKVGSTATAKVSHA
ncbi:MAG: ammonium transporter [Phycisphaerae bacterium]|nr:ammonium transporter [Tepidisphaeraceae bacterium]